MKFYTNSLEFRVRPGRRSGAIHQYSVQSAWASDTPLLPPILGAAPALAGSEPLGTLVSFCQHEIHSRMTTWRTVSRTLCLRWGGAWDCLSYDRHSRLRVALPENA